jgi:3-phenylpropionate/trans-cinnamate dioxygenase ferredoxin subunit
MSYKKVLQINEVMPGEKVRVDVDGKVILLANLDGTYYALDDLCPHQGGSLSKGAMRDGKVICPRHGAAFDLKTGKNVGDAKIAFINIKVHDAKAYPVKVEGEDVLIEIE